MMWIWIQLSILSSICLFLYSQLVPTYLLRRQNVVVSWNNPNCPWNIPLHFLYSLYFCDWCICLVVFRWHWWAVRGCVSSSGHGDSCLKMMNFCQRCWWEGNCCWPLVDHFKLTEGWVDFLKIQIQGFQGLIWSVFSGLGKWIPSSW